MEYYLAIDFDGTIACTDVTDAVLERFADPKWIESETRWKQGLIGSAQCLREQMALIHTPLSEILQFVSQIEIDESFIEFAIRVRQLGLPMAIISDGFTPFIRAILAEYGLTSVPIYANGLSEKEGELIVEFPHQIDTCASGTCKCHVVSQLAKGLPVYLIGDGRSDFCLARQADYVYAKAELVDYCRENNIDYSVYRNFTDICKSLETSWPDAVASH